MAYLKKVVDQVRKDKYMIEEKDIERRHEIICNGIMEEDFDIYTIRPYYTKDVWKAVMNVIKAKQINDMDIPCM